MKRTATLGILATVSLSCSDGAPSGPGAFNNLVFTRDDGSAVSFRQDALQALWCGPWDTKVPAPSLHIAFGGPTVSDPSWRVTAVVADVTIGEPLTFPSEFIFGQPKGALLFVGDPPNEASTGVGGSDGTLTFQELACTIGSAVEFRIDAVVASEFHNGSSIRVTGNFRAQVGEGPELAARWRRPHDATSNARLDRP